MFAETCFTWNTFLYTEEAKGSSPLSPIGLRLFWSLLNGLVTTRFSGYAGFVMPIAPEPRWNPRRRRWYVTLQRKQYILGYGKENKHKAWEKFIRIRAEVYGVSPPGEPATVNQLVERFLRLYPSPKNATLLKSWAFFQEGPLGGITNDCLVAYAGWLKEQGNGEWTVKGKVGVAARVIGWACQHEYLTIRPIRPKLAKPPKGHRDIPRRNLPKMLKKMDTTRRRRTGTIFKFILATGCRPGEARKLRWNHIDLDEREARLSHREHKSGKETGEERVIYLNDDAVKALREASDRDGLRGFVFRNNLGRPFPHGGIYQNVSRWLGITPNQLRHTFAQNALDQVGLDDVAAQLGHKSTRMTSIYAEVRSRRAKMVARSLLSPLSRSDQSSVPVLGHLQEPGKKHRGESASA